MGTLSILNISIWRQSIDVPMLVIEVLLVVIKYESGSPLHPFFLRGSVSQWLEPGFQHHFYQDSNPSSATQTTLASY